MFSLLAPLYRFESVVPTIISTFCRIPSSVSPDSPFVEDGLQSMLRNPLSTCRFRVLMLWSRQLCDLAVEVVAKPHLVSDGCVAIRFKMYCSSARVLWRTPLLNRIDALPSNTI